MSGLLKEQNNVPAHPPGCKLNVSDMMEKHSLQIYQICTEPVFISQKSMTWRWILAGLTIYMIDLCFRLFRRRCHVKLLGVQVYECQLICLKLLKEGFNAQPGQYVYLQCPHISFLEWHPFSISQCPTADDPSLTIHLRTNGDWSEYLKHYLLSGNDEKREDIQECSKRNVIYLSSSSINKRLFVDGPYSSCFEDVLRYSVSICIAGGIGFTPFASILRYLSIDVKHIRKMKRLHFFWICREVEVFKCFSKVLCEMFEMVWRKNHPDKFELHLYLTKKESWDTIKNILQDSFPFLKPRIQFGRPQWDVLFEQWANTYKKIDVGLFCCGPQRLNHEIKLLNR
ncbi:NADPH oxidase 4, partial [Stegodyphus mimosarum]